MENWQNLDFLQDPATVCRRMQSLTRVVSTPSLQSPIVDYELDPDRLSTRRTLWPPADQSLGRSEPGSDLEEVKCVMHDLISSVVFTASLQVAAEEELAAAAEEELDLEVLEAAEAAEGEWLAIPQGSDSGYNCCSSCDHTISVVEARGMGGEDYLELVENTESQESVVMCRSCIVGEYGMPFIQSTSGSRWCGTSMGFFCVDCGFSEVLSMQFHGTGGSFYDSDLSRSQYMRPLSCRPDQNTRCQDCRERFVRDDTDTVPPWNEPVDSNDELSWYEGEYEVYEDEEDEVYEDEDEYGKFEETKSKVKDIVKEMGGVMFDIQSSITEGEYLILMNGLQAITNQMNH